MAGSAGHKHWHVVVTTLTAATLSAGLAARTRDLSLVAPQLALGPSDVRLGLRAAF